LSQSSMGGRAAPQAVFAAAVAGVCVLLLCAVCVCACVCACACAYDVVCSGAGSISAPVLLPRCCWIMMALGPVANNTCCQKKAWARVRESATCARRRESGCQRAVARRLCAGAARVLVLGRCGWCVGRRAAAVCASGWVPGASVLRLNHRSMLGVLVRECGEFFGGWPSWTRPPKIDGLGQNSRESTYIGGFTNSLAQKQWVCGHFFCGM